MTAAELVTSCLDNPAIISRIGPDDNLQAIGLNSGEIIKIALACEDHLGRQLSDQEMSTISSLRGVARLLAGVGDVA